jgi:hypothetical protein
MNQQTMTLHVTALFIHTFFMVMCQVVTFYVFLHPSSKNMVYINVSRIFMFTSNAVSQVIVIFLFLQFSKPVSLKQEVKDDSDDSDYEEEFDRSRDPNLDMMFYVKQMPKMQRLKEDYDIDEKEKTALDYIFEERVQDGETILEECDYIRDDAKIDGFTESCVNQWGQEETQLRTAIYISFVKNADTLNFRKKIKKARKSVIRQS